MNRRRFLKCAATGLLLPAAPAIVRGQAFSFRDLPYMAPKAKGGNGLLPGLASYWKFDESSTGAAAIDSVGAETLTDQSSLIQRVAGKLNNCADYYTPIWVNGGGAPPGIYDGLRHADDAVLGIGAGVQFTFTGWFRENVLNGSVFLCKADDEATNIDYVLTSNGSQWTWNCIQADTASAAVTKNGVAGNTWFFLSVGFDGSNIWIQVNAGSRSTAVCTDVRRTSSGFCVGNWSNARVGHASPLLGFVDEMGFWRRSLSTAEVTLVYNGGTPLPLSSF